MTEQQLIEDYKAFSQCWKLYKKYAPAEKINENAWNAFLKEAGELQSQFGDSPMTKILWGTQQAIDQHWTERERRSRTCN